MDVSRVAADSVYAVRMPIIPILKISDRGALKFYTDVLDFDVVHANEMGDGVYAVLLREGEELHLTNYAAKDVAGGMVYVRVSDVDAVFAKFAARGLDVVSRPESPVHCGPVDQTWGMREFYVTDADRNTLCFGMEIVA